MGKTHIAAGGNNVFYSAIADTKLLNSMLNMYEQLTGDRAIATKSGDVTNSRYDTVKNLFLKYTKKLPISIFTTTAEKNAEYLKSMDWLRLNLLPLLYIVDVGSLTDTDTHEYSNFNFYNKNIYYSYTGKKTYNKNYYYIYYPSSNFVIDSSKFFVGCETAVTSGSTTINGCYIIIRVYSDDYSEYQDAEFNIDRDEIRFNPINKVSVSTSWEASFFAIVGEGGFSRDPYNKGGSSSKSGGTGDFDATSEAVTIPRLPTLSATDTGFITLFNPTSSELKNLANYMWSNPLFDLSAWKKIFADPMDAVLGLSIVPVAVPDAGSGTVTVGNISTGISMNKAGAQYVSVDCGTLNVNEYWGAYLDYSPYTKIEIYLPYIGTHPLDIDDVMGKAVHVVYHVDILSGACTAYVQCGDSVLYSFIGQCSSSIPITGNDWTNVINGTISIAASIGTMVATGGASAPFAATAIASTATNSLKPTVEKSGAMGGTGGLLGIQTPYLILTRPRQALPENQNTFTGYPSFITSTLSNLSGYTEIESCHLQGIPATEQELNEIENLLKKGVII